MPIMSPQITINMAAPISSHLARSEIGGFLSTVKFVFVILMGSVSLRQFSGFSPCSMSFVKVYWPGEQHSMGLSLDTTTISAYFGLS